MTDDAESGHSTVPLRTVVREWTRIGVTGFGGPAAHVVLLRQLMVEREGWMDAEEFQDANAACGMLPGPASTQLAIFCAYRVAGRRGAVVGGLGFVLPAVVLILLLSVLFLSAHPPLWVQGAGAGASAAVPAVALQAARGFLPPSFAAVRGQRGREARWFTYVLVAAAAAIWVGPYLVLVLLACGAMELVGRRRPTGLGGFGFAAIPALSATGGYGALAWTALKVGALSFGGGFVIIPLMQGDAVHAYHWMTDAEFLNAVALGQITPGPVVATVAAVGYAAHGIAGGILAATVAFAPSFTVIVLGGSRFEHLRGNTNARAFLDGAGPAAIGAIIGAAVLLTSTLARGWQFALLALALLALVMARRGTVETLLAAGLVGTVLTFSGVPT